MEPHVRGVHPMRTEWKKDAETTALVFVWGGRQQRVHENANPDVVFWKMVPESYLQKRALPSTRELTRFLAPRGLAGIVRTLLAFGRLASTNALADQPLPGFLCVETDYADELLTLNQCNDVPSKSKKDKHPRQNRQSSRMQAWIKMVVGKQPGKMNEENNDEHVSSILKKRESGRQTKAERSSYNPRQANYYRSVRNPVQQYYSPPTGRLPSSEHLRFDIRFHVQKESI